MRRKNIVLIAVLATAFGACVSAEQRLAQQRERDPQYQYEKAVVCMNAGLTDEALKYIDLSLGLDPNSAMAYYLRGHALTTKGDLRGAITAFERCLQLKPDFSDGHNYLACALRENGDAERAEREFEKAFALDLNPNASYNLANISRLAGKYETALDFVRKSLQKNPRSLMALNLQGMILESMDKLDDAVASYEMALKIVPDEPNVEYNRAVVYYKKQDFEKAKAILERVKKTLEKPSANTAQDRELRARVEDVLKRINSR